MLIGTFIALAALALAIAGWAWRRRSRRSKATTAGRADAAGALCKQLDLYVESISEPAHDIADTDALWQRLDCARKIKRKHFPQLSAEMLELVRVHGEITTLVVRDHVERLGVSSDRAPLAPEGGYQSLRERARLLVEHLKRRCLALANTDPTR
jgi:hypothetical protein